MDIGYRYVAFGTRFTRASGCRTDPAERVSDLYENELAVDVGGECWGFNTDLPVIDNHFFRAAGHFPCAAAGVLHNAGRIQRKFGGADTLWLVTHVQPDFDGLCAMYLARVILLGLVPHDWDRVQFNPDGWFRTRNEIDWFFPDVRGTPLDRRWPVLLASNAASVDHGRRLRCPRNRGLHSILYAALHRGRDYGSNGALEFFNEVMAALRRDESPLNPLLDSVLEGSRTFAPELAFLDRELEAYERDISRARRVVVNVSSGVFSEWYPKVQNVALLADGFSRAGDQQSLPSQSRSQVDGIYIRDPECLLFKEWARLDNDNSSMGNGFVFTAVAYSGLRRDAAVNSTDYYFALDPERASSRHLYNLWVRLETEEIKALSGASLPSLHAQLERAEEQARASGSSRCRPGFEKRAGIHAAFFDDPWFDGSNYQSTIVATPNRGTVIGEPGIRSDLTDDPVAALVQDELEYSFFRPPMTIEDLSASSGKPDRPPNKCSIEEACQSPVASGYYRFGTIELWQDVDLSRAPLVKQIGAVLWRTLESGDARWNSSALEPRLLADSELIGVWSRRGLVLAHKSDALLRVHIVGEKFKHLISLAREVSEVVRLDPSKGGGREIVSRCQRLMPELARMSHALIEPELELLRGFFESSHLDSVLDSLHQAHSAVHEMEMAGNMTENIKTVAEVQKVIHLIEYMVGAAYVAELWHLMAGPSLASHDGYHLSILLFAGVGVVLVEVMNFVAVGRSPALSLLKRMWKAVRS